MKRIICRFLGHKYKHSNLRNGLFFHFTMDVICLRCDGRWDLKGGPMFCELTEKKPVDSF